MKLFIGILWVVCLVGNIALAIYYHHSGEVLEAVYYMLFAIFLLLCIKK